VNKRGPIRKLLLVGLVAFGIFLAASAFAATIVSSDALVLGVPHVYVTSKTASGGTVATTGAITGSSSKKAHVVKFTVGGTELDVLVRIEVTKNGTFIDLVGDATITSLSTTVLGMNLTTSGHPSPTKDSVDTTALVSAGGS